MKPISRRYETNGFIKILENSYGMKIQTVSLDDIVGYFVSSRSEKISKFVQIKVNL